MTTPSVHGMRPAKVGGEFHFATMNLFKVLRDAQTFPGTNKYPGITWTRERLSHFVISFGKFEDTIWKIERVAELLDDSRRKFLEVREAFRKTENIVNFQQAMKDFPLYLDVLLLYFRIFVDALAVLTRQLPGFEGNEVNGRSFREQKKWFIEKMPDVDPEYAEILQRETNWFTTLAGDKPGQGLQTMSYTEWLGHSFSLFQVELQTKTKSKRFCMAVQALREWTCCLQSRTW